MTRWSIELPACASELFWESLVWMMYAIDLGDGVKGENLRFKWLFLSIPLVEGQGGGPKMALKWLQAPAP